MTIDEAIRHLETYSSTNGSGQTTQQQHEEAKRIARVALRTINGWMSIMETDLLYGTGKHEADQ